MNSSTPDLESSIKDTITNMAVKYDVKVPATNEKVLSIWILLVEKSALQIVSNDEIKVILNSEEMDLNNLPIVKDRVYIFEQESYACNSNYVLKEIDDNGCQITLNLMQEDSFERPVTIQMLVENNELNKEIRESLLGYIQR